MNIHEISGLNKVHSRNIIYTLVSFIKCSSFQFCFFPPLLESTKFHGWILKKYHSWIFNGCSFIDEYGQNFINEKAELSWNKGWITHWVDDLGMLTSLLFYWWYIAKKGEKKRLSHPYSSSNKNKFDENIHGVIVLFIFSSNYFFVRYNALFAETVHCMILFNFSSKFFIQLMPYLMKIHILSWYCLFSHPFFHPIICAVFLWKYT